MILTTGGREEQIRERIGKGWFFIYLLRSVIYLVSSRLDALKDRIGRGG